MILFFSKIFYYYNMWLCDTVTVTDMWYWVTFMWHFVTVTYNVMLILILSPKYKIKKKIKIVKSNVHNSDTFYNCSSMNSYTSPLSLLQLHSLITFSLVFSHLFSF